MDKLLSFENKSNNLLFLIGFLFLLYLLFYLRVHIQEWFNVYTAKPYSSDDPQKLEPVSKGLITWMIHGYVPDHNAGSEWMAHAINTHWIREMNGRVNVITQNPSVTVYDRVSILDEKNKPFDSLLQRSQLLLTHHLKTPNAVQTALLTQKPLVIVLHDNWKYKHVKEAKRWLGDNLYIITNSQWLDKYYAPLKIPSCVCYPPVNWREYATETNRNYVTLINVNRNKGGDIFIQIAKQMPDVKFMGVQGAYGKQIFSKEPNITYVKTTPEIKTIYAQTNILLMPSNEESWGRTAIEAMSSGIPVIAHPTPGLLESCGDAGIFCDRNDISAWVREIRKLLNNEEYYQTHSLACKKRAIELDPEKHLNRVCQWMNELRWKEGGSPGHQKYPLIS